MSRRRTTALAALLLTLAAGAPAAHAAPGTLALAIGDSVASGTQDGAPAVASYAALVAQRASATLTNLSCPGATTASIVAPGPAACGAPQSQREAALAFLAAHPGAVSPILISAGGNDLLGGADLAAMQTRLAALLQELRDAAPSADLVVTGYGDPLAIGPVAHAAFHDRLRAAVAAVKDVRFVDPYPRFNADAAAVCAYLRVCTVPGDVHPTAAGHALLADLVWEALGYGAAPAPEPTFGTPSTGGTPVSVPAPSAPVTTGPPATGAVLGASAAARISTVTLTRDRRVLRLRVACRATHAAPCRVLVVVRQRGRELGRARLRVRPGRAVILRLQLRRAAVRQVAVSITAYVDDAARPAARVTVP